MISIGAVYNGPELKGYQIDHSIMAVTKVLKKFRGPLEKGEAPWVNAVFVVSGSLGEVEFNGLLYGHVFSNWHGCKQNRDLCPYPSHQR